MKYMWPEENLYDVRKKTCDFLNATIVASTLTISGYTNRECNPRRISST